MPASTRATSSLFALPPLAAYFAWQRRLGLRVIGVLAALFVVGAVGANAYPLAEDSQTTVLTAIHLPIALWLVVGVAYVGGDWRSDRRRMDFIRFTGEWLIYFVLIGLGGGVLTAFTVGTFDAIGLDAERFVTSWLLPCGAMAAVVVVGMAGGGQAERHREHGAGADPRLHPAVRGRAAGVPGRHDLDQQRHRRRARCADPLRPAARRRAGPAAVRHLRPRPCEPGPACSTACSSRWSSAL